MCKRGTGQVGAGEILLLIFQPLVEGGLVLGPE